MATTPTANYAFGKPAVGGDSGAWGSEINTALDAIDTQIKATDTIAQAALPKAGGTMTGAITGKTATMVRVDKGTTSGAVSLDLSAAQGFTITVNGATTFSLANVPAGALVHGFVMKITNGGAGVVTWFSQAKFASASAPALTVSGIDYLAFLSLDGGTTYGLVGLRQDVR